MRSRRLFGKLFAVLTVLAAFCAPARAEVLGYGVDTNSDLYLINLTTANATLIGNIAAAGFPEGLAISPAGELFVTNSGGGLSRLDPVTAAVTVIGNTGRGNIEGLDFNGNILLGSDFNATPTIFSINTTNASTANVVTVAANTGVIRSMTVLDSNTVLARTDGPVNNTLRSINLTTGATSVIGTINAQIAAGLDFGSDGNLYALDSDGRVLLINPTNAATTVVGDTGNQFWLALAAIPAGQPQAVPEPTSLALFGLGGLAFAGYVWRRRRVS